MVSNWLVPIVVAIVGGGGLFGGIVAIMKFRPEAASMAVITAEKVVILQAGIIDDLDARLNGLQAQVALLRDELAEVQSSRTTLLAENAALREENVALRQKIGEIEGRVERVEHPDNGGT